MPSMIQLATDCSSSITNLQIKDYDDILQQSVHLENIVNLTIRLDQCIDDQSKFHEAIDLLESIDHLHKKYGSQVPIIETIYRQSERQRRYLISNLCEKLERPKHYSQTEIILLVNYLMRCGNFSDRELRLKYLQARDNWFNNSCEEQSASFDSVVALHCSGLPMIFQEYKNLFGDSSEILDRKLMKLSTTDPTKEDGAIINSWLLLKISIFIASLTVYLDTIRRSGTQTPTMISDTMQKCFELTDWLASIGFDFSSELKPLFSKALIREVESSIERATEKFEIVFRDSISKSIEHLLLPVDDEILRISELKLFDQLPKSIEHYPIFRVYCLDIINSLRWLQATKKTLPPMSMCTDIYASLNSSLTRIMKALAIILNMDNNYNHPILTKIAISLVTEVLPFIASCCEKLFPERIVLSAIGLSKTEFKNVTSREPGALKNFSLDFKQIAEPLAGTMPALLQTIEC